ncbi:hypothetical protein NRP93_000909 [Clostridium botulinum]|nr:hypothetical protein [Clostridium botulinum]
MEVVLENLIKGENLNGKEYIYYYKLIKSDLYISWKNEDIKMQSYGIEIMRKDFKEEQLKNIESNDIRHISPHRYKVHNLLRILYEQTVSPIHLVDIIGEYVDEYVDDYENVLKSASSMCK